MGENTAQPLYYFEALPVHPQPELLESFTSYLLRLAEANHIQTWQTALWLGFTGGKRIHPWRIKDLPQGFSGRLPQLAVCPEAQLRRLTFHPLGEKFGRPTAPQPLSVFLKGAVGDDLRYCPTCLAERKYYSLVWRFRCVDGCALHGRRLLERCGHCRQRIPVFGPLLKIGVCPWCQGDLGACVAEPLAAPQRHRVQHQTSELAFLLAGQAGSVDRLEQALRVGQQLAAWREQRGVAQLEAAHQLKLAPLKLRALEQGADRGGIKFMDYVRYAEYLEVTMPVLFATPVAPEALARLKAKSALATNEEALVHQVLKAIEHLKAQGLWVTRTAISRAVGITDKQLSRWPRVRPILEAVAADRQTYRALAREDQQRRWVQQTPPILEAMLSTGKRLTRKELARRLGAPRPIVHRNPEIAALFRAAVARRREAHRRQFQERENQLVEQVQQAIQAVKARGQPVSQRTIGLHLHIFPACLWHSPRVRALLMKERQGKPQRRRKPSQKQAKERKLLARVQEAIQCLQQQGQPVTKTNISQRVGHCLLTLRQYPEIQLILQRVGERYRRELQAARRQRAAAVMEKVQAAVRQLQAAHQPVTQAAVSQATGMKLSRLRQYPSVAGLLKQIAADRRQRLQQQLRQREDRLLQQMQRLIEQFTAKRMPITAKAIAQALNVPRARVERSPRVQQLLHQSGQWNRSLRLARLQAREADLIRRLEQAARTSQRRGQALTRAGLARDVGLTPSGLNYYPRVRMAVERIIHRGESERLDRVEREMPGLRRRLASPWLAAHEPPDPDWRMPDALWREIEPWLPPKLARPYRPQQSTQPLSARQVMDAVFYVLRMECVWAHLPPDLGVPRSIYSRFRNWLVAGVFTRLWDAGLLTPEKIQGVSRSFYERLLLA